MSNSLTSQSQSPTLNQSRVAPGTVLDPGLYRPRRVFSGGARRPSFLQSGVGGWSCADHRF